MRSNLLVTDSGQVKTARQTKAKTIFEAVVRLTEQKSVFKNFVKFIGKHLRHSLFFNKVAGLNKHIINEDSIVVNQVSENCLG